MRSVSTFSPDDLKVPSQIIGWGGEKLGGTKDGDPKYRRRDPFPLDSFEGLGFWERGENVGENGSSQFMPKE